MPAVTTAQRQPITEGVQTPNVSVPDPERGGGFGDRKVSVSASGPIEVRVSDIAGKPVGASRNLPETNQEEPASPAHAAARTVVQDLGKDFTLGPIHKLSNYFANNADHIPQKLKPDLETALMFADQVDKDMTRLSELLQKSETKPLSEAELVEVKALTASNKYNLTLVQGWLSETNAGLASNGATGAAARTLIQGLGERLADRHLDLADLVCMYDLDLDQIEGNEAVSRGDRINANIIDVSAALLVARQMEVPGLDAGARRQLVGALEEQHELLTQAKRMADENVGPGQLPAGDKLKLAAKEIWETPFAMVKGKKGDADSIKQLHAHWDAKARGDDTSERWLPLAHPKVGHERLMREFIAHRFKAAGVSEDDMPDLKFVLKEAKNAIMNDQDWSPVSKQVTFKVNANLEATVNSKITPAGAFSKHFAQDYVSKGINCSDRLQYKHVPNLAHTQLTNENGDVLFSGLRHGVLDSYDLRASKIKALPDSALMPMISDLLYKGGIKSEWLADYGNEFRDLLDVDPRKEEIIDSVLTDIRNNPARTSQFASEMRTLASNNMAEELAVAAVVSDPAKLQDALDGKEVNVNLSSVSLLTPDYLRKKVKGASSDEQTMLSNQTKALQSLAEREQPVELTLRGDDGQLRTFKANIGVRTFNFGVNEGAVGKSGGILPSTLPGWKQAMGWGFAARQNDPALTRLLGEKTEGELGGDISRKLRDSGASGEDSAALARVAREVKDMWRDESFTSGDNDPYKMVSRLTLLGGLMGETPVFNCKSGKDRTGQLDAEVKFLAAMNDKGAMPEPGTQLDDHSRMSRSNFTLNTGNLEMQRMNTGLPGYKLDWKGVPGLANMVADKGLEPLYRGGSRFVAS